MMDRRPGRPSEVPKPLAHSEVDPASVTTYYTVPSGTVTELYKLMLVNGAAAARTVDVYFVPTGDTADLGANAVTRALSLPQGEPVLLELTGVYLDGEYKIQAQASGADVSLYVSGKEHVR